MPLKLTCLCNVCVMQVVEAVSPSEPPADQTDGPGSSTPAVSPPQPPADQLDGPGSSTPAVSPPQPPADQTEGSSSPRVPKNLNRSFSDLMPTPKIAKSNRARSRKSINYKASVVSKQLFDDYNSKLQINKEAKKSRDKSASKRSEKNDQKAVKKGAEERIKSARKRSRDKSASKGSEKGDQQAGTKGAEERIKSSRKKRKSNSKASAKGKGLKRAKISSVMNSADGGAEAWYCNVCKEDTQLTMTKCRVCHTWLHNECVGLESDDDDDFICPYCDA